MSTRLTREQVEVRLDTVEQKAIRADRYGNLDSNSMPHLRQMEKELKDARGVILAHDAALREELAQAQVEHARLREALEKCLEDYTRWRYASPTLIDKAQAALASREGT